MYNDLYRTEKSKGKTKKRHAQTRHTVTVRVHGEYGGSLGLRAKLFGLRQRVWVGLGLGFRQKGDGEKVG